MSKIRVLILVTDLNIGGVPLFIKDLACGLSTLDHQALSDNQNSSHQIFDIHVACLAPHGPIADELRSYGIKTHCLNARGPWDLRTFYRLAALLHKLKPHILQCCLMHANVAGAVIGKCMGTKRVFTSTHTAEKGKLWHLTAENLICRLHPISVCISHSVKRHLVRHAHISPSRLSVIYYGINCPKFAQAQSADLSEFGFTKKHKTLIFVGRLDPVKNIDLILHALSQLASLQKQKLQLLIVGDGPQRPQLETLTKQLNLNDCVHFTGARRDVERLLKAADLFLMPSKWEGFGLSAAEAMAAGLPVIASRTDGLIDVIDHNINGLLVSPNDLNELTQSIKSLLDNPQKMKILGLAAQKKAHQHYSINTMIKNYAKFYHNLLQ
ncbi:MAG: glycosyltransferase [Planctomycetes bacterium]|nr:glycosyltransferase [Planctomycetota bacterium]